MNGDEILYEHAVIHTMVPGAEPAEALLVRDGSIQAVGSRTSVASATQGDARRVDLGGCTVFPGFNDCHCHILGIGLDLSQVDVSSDAVHTVADIQRAVRARREAEPEMPWILGRGYDQNMLAEAWHPSRDDLDAAVADCPVVLRHTSGHVLTSNSQALREAGITENTPDPAGGVIERDDHGRPTGVLKESAMELMNRVIPPPPEEVGSRAIEQAMARYASLGVTSATDAATGGKASLAQELAMYRRAAQGDRLRGRITLLPQIYFVAPPDSDEVVPPEEFDLGVDPRWLAVVGTKIFSDGAMSTRTAAMRESYQGEAGNRGILLWEQSTLIDMMRRAHGAGWQIATHALGDRAVEVVLAAYAQVLTAQPRHDHRHRIEHAMVLDEGLARRMKTLGIVPVLQPDIFRLGDGYITALGLDRAQEVIPLRVFEAAGLPIAFSSDAPVIPADPLRVIRSAVERSAPSDVTLGLHHAATVHDAIRYYTAGGAYATHTDSIKGTLEPGKLADFVVLSRDPLSTPIVDFDDIQVMTTVVNGERVFEAS